MVLIGIIFNIIETAFFGFNMKPMTHSEEVCDTICKLLFQTGLIFLFLGFYLKKPSKESSTEDKVNDKALSRILHYSFDPISWHYDSLSRLEKAALSPSEFEAIKSKYKDMDY